MAWANLGAKELAEALGCSRQTVFFWLQSRRKIPCWAEHSIALITRQKAIVDAATSQEILAIQLKRIGENRGEEI